MASTTARGVPYPEATDAANVPVSMKALADWINDNTVRQADVAELAQESAAAFLATDPGVAAAAADAAATAIDTSGLATDLTAEVTRAEAAEGTIRTQLATAMYSDRFLLGGM